MTAAHFQNIESMEVDGAQNAMVKLNAVSTCLIVGLQRQNASVSTIVGISVVEETDV
jgi:hypothetical protein